MGKETKIKCVVWDLDNTLWHGILAENDTLVLRENVVRVIKILDERGILQSIASRNTHERAMEKVRAFGLEEYFLYPQIHWNSKVTSIEQIAQSLNIGINTFAFVDDQPFERDEVKFSLPEVLCIDALEVDQIPAMSVMNPRFLTSDSRQRRIMYQSDIVRNQVEADFAGPKETFLSTLNMVITIAPAGPEDLQRAEELTVRTNQLNATGYTYSYEELDAFCHSDQHRLLIASLDDKYGTYGKIGLVLLETAAATWTIKLLLMSCRVMSRGVGSILITYIRQEAKKNQVRLLAEFVPTDRNRMMYITYKFAHFREIETDEPGDVTLLENDLSTIPPFPDYIQVNFIGVNSRI
ncbi:MAG: HAD-IIIC family phosphatase [Magnetococcales bacterium]|nr:HAD-IIIC family phosphatase [Magnetococcales bacterium]MBF0439449.1 HAD-IIIC family phosphatase [Magnetococcales bacterium]